jgi:hypothetical protein
MSSWYGNVVNDITQIVDCVAHFESELNDAKSEVKIKGSLERASAALPGITENRYTQLQEVEAILEHLNIDLRCERSKVFRKYLEHYNRQLSSRDAEKYVDGEPSVISLTRLTNQFGLLRNQYLGILKGLESKSYQLNNVVKLRCAGMEDIVIA